jgi:deferrochelatase/peroxidase EfeB
MADDRPARLTLTFGVGASLFERDGAARFGLVGARPDALAALPAFDGDAIDPARSDGDLSVQACADDPQVVAHALQTLTRIGRGTAKLRWSQRGFSPTSTTSPEGDTPRNLMGFKDGTNNIKLDEPAALRRDVWVGDGDDPAWMRNGSYAVVRRIRMLLDAWDATPVDDQERTIGRMKHTGAPIGQGIEHAPVDLDATVRGEPVIPLDAHIRLAAPSENGNARLLRRGYSYDDGNDAGLFFLAYQRDPQAQFVPLQTRLARHDALNAFIRHTASAVFACPPGATAGGYVGETLFD